MTVHTQTLLLAWGNPGRLDDGLGPALARAVEAMRLPGVVVETAHQLQIEHSQLISRFDRVLFADADRVGPAPFSLSPLRPDCNGVCFSSHIVSPGAVLSLARDLFGAAPEAWLATVRGYEFDDFGERLSRGALSNLHAATLEIGTALASGRLDRIGSHRGEESPADDREVDSCQTANR